jgi:hypothetical protein
MTKRRAVPLLPCILLLALSACSVFRGSAVTLTPSTRLEYSADDMQLAQQNASAACAFYQQTAKLQDTITRNGNHIAVFACR